jgi:tetratricopeptide (TPR) repeat protein
MAKTGTKDQIALAKELNATVFLNMSICFFLLKNYSKAVEKATLSLQNKKTLKGLYRRGKAYAARLDYERAIKDMEDAVKMDPSDVNDIQQEIMQLRMKMKELEKKNN